MTIVDTSQRSCEASDAAAHVAIAWGSLVLAGGAPGCYARAEQRIVNQGAVDRGPGASFDQRSTSGDVKEVPSGHQRDDRRMAPLEIIVKLIHLQPFRTRESAHRVIAKTVLRGGAVNARRPVNVARVGAKRRALTATSTAPDFHARWASSSTPADTLSGARPGPWPARVCAGRSRSDSRDVATPTTDMQTVV